MIIITNSPVKLMQTMRTDTNAANIELFFFAVFAYVRSLALYYLLFKSHRTKTLNDHG